MKPILTDNNSASTNLRNCAPTFFNDNITRNNSFSGLSLKASSNDSTMTMAATGMGVNGFGRIGRLVTRIMQEDEACELKAINAGSATTDYMAYQYKYDPIHGKAKGTVEVDGDFSWTS